MSEERLAIVAEPREITGKKVKQLRRVGLTPAVIYGATEAINIQLDARTLRRMLRKSGGSSLIDVQIGAETRTVLARDIQQHPTRNEMVHVDFLEVDLKIVIASEAELVMVGNSKATASGLGIVSLAMRTVEIEALPEDLISEIEVDISLIKRTDDVITVADLKAPKGVTILTDPETTVASFAYERAALDEEEEAEEEGDYAPAADSVEVIAKGKDEEDF
ncbi:MAG: 50S ribosomal protein L25 [Chloroflexota bacterium]